MSRWILIGIFILIVSTHIHDPVHRDLADDADIDQLRTWCLAQYSNSMTVYNSFITIFHFLMPFGINILSAIWLIIGLARSHEAVQHDQSYRQHIKAQFDQHRHILITLC
ncbi:unnamed protein product [Adineta ricciae]|uniref:Uncharacterized protein n=1 Tax=Adineta ricciae TaxID=249248 RepID=A0A815MQ46_ADIRI|nr:unnamed protein product [Adineta ricciae]CAF1427870.1 unnamed protein product [Adineta ricciae]